MFTRVKTPEEIAAMRESGKMLATVLDLLGKSVSDGMSTKDLSEIAKNETRKLGGLPTFLGFDGYPDVICVSVNDEVVHGIPREDHIIRNGDIVSMDYGVTYKSMITDAAISVIVGKPHKKQHQKLVDDTRISLMQGISVLRDGISVGSIGHAVESYLAPRGYGIVRDLVGHGVGHELHETPNIPNYGRENTGPHLSMNMTIAIEPMATLGDWRVSMDPDGWTFRTADGSLSAHFEHTILITEDSFEILTEL